MSNEVGRVSVRVIPNTRGFRKETAQQLRGLKDKLALKVKVEADWDKFKMPKKLPKGKDELPAPKMAPPKLNLDQFQKDALKELKKISGKLEQKIPLTVDGEKARADLRRKISDIERTIKAEIPAEIDLASNARAQVRDALDELSRSLPTQNKTLRVDLDADRSKAEAQLQALMSSIQDMSQDGTGHILLKVEDSKAKEDLRAAIAVLKAEAAMADIEVSMSVDASPAALAGASGAMLSRFATLATIAAGAITLFLGPALALLSGALVALPGLIGGIAIPMGAVALMTSDLAKAFENVTGPIAALGPPLIDLQTSLKGSFFAGFTGELNGTANGITILRDAIGQLSGPLNNLTGALGEALTGAIQGLLSGGGLESMKTLITNIGDGFREAAPAIGQMVASFAKLAAAMTGQGMVDAFTKLAQSFADWVGKEENINLVTDALTGLLTVLTSMGPHFGDLLKQGIEAMGDPNFVNNIKDLIGGLLTLVGVLASVGNAFASLEGTWSFIVGFIKEVGTGLGNVISTLAGFAESIWNFGNLIGEATKFALGFITTMAASLGSVLASGFQTAVATVTAIWNGFVNFIVTRFQMIPQAVTNIVSTIGGAFGSLVSTVAGVVGQIPGVVANIFGQVTSVIVGAVSTVVAAAAAGFAQLVSTIVTAMGEALAAVVAGTGNIVSEVTTLGGRVVSAVSGFVGAMVSAGADLIAGLARGIASAAGNAIAAAADVGRQIIGAVKGIFNSNSPSKVFMGIGEDVVDGLTIGIGDNQHLAADRAAGMAQGVVDSARKVIADGIDPLMVDVQLNPEALENLKREKDILDLQAKTLGVQKDQAPDKMSKAALQAQLDQINARKREIALIQEQADYQKKYGQEVQATQDTYASHIEKMAKIPYDFAKTTATGFLGDMGISGNGMLSELANIGMDYGSKFVFNVMDMDSAVSGMQNVQRKQALQFG